MSNKKRQILILGLKILGCMLIVTVLLSSNILYSQLNKAGKNFMTGLGVVSVIAIFRYLFFILVVLFSKDKK